MTEKTIEYYLSLPYRVEVYPDEDGKGFAALVPDLPGCMTAADTREELWPMLEDAKRLWLEVALEDGIPIPEPKPLEEEEFSGKFVLRLPKTLHRQLARLSEEEGASLNALVVSLISQAMGNWYGYREQVRARAEKYILASETGPIRWESLVAQYAEKSAARRPSAEWAIDKKLTQCVGEARGEYA